MPHVIAFHASKSGMVDLVIEALQREYQWRLSVCAGYNVHSINAFNRGSFSDNKNQAMYIPRMYIILDSYEKQMSDGLMEIARNGRACGMHIIATSSTMRVKEVDGLMKSAFMVRASFHVKDIYESELIVNTADAERIRTPRQMVLKIGPNHFIAYGPEVEDVDIQRMTNYWSSNDPHTAEERAIQQVSFVTGEYDHGFDFGKEKGRDEFFYKAAEHIIDSEKASIGYLQRIFRIGFNRASTLLDELADAGIVGPDEGTITRRVLFTKEDYEDWKSRGEPKDFFPLHANSKKFAQITDVNKADEANVRSTPHPKKTFFQRLFNR